ncbi:MAG TPA: YhjD/YihY/BrkB family envelope integrity protein [Actinomycetota bacterium]|nr:YhjD/YihY/BrkB family envelope integrity protein [Actinomycetota bacterium]
MLGTLAQWPSVRLVRSVLARSAEDDVSTHAAALAYQLFLSTLALSLVALSVYGLVDRVTSVEVVEGAEEQLENLKKGGVVLGIVSFLGLLWTASALARRAATALAVVFRSPPERVTGRLLRAVGTTLGLVGIVGVLPVATGLIAGLEGAGALEIPVKVLGFAATAALEFGLFLLSYVALTPSAGSWRTHVPGALVMTLAWEVFKLLGGLLVDRLIANATLLYGTIGAVVGILVVLRLTTGLYLFGAELSAVMAERHSGSVRDV